MKKVRMLTVGRWPGGDSLGTCHAPVHKYQVRKSTKCYGWWETFLNIQHCAGKSLQRVLCVPLIMMEQWLKEEKAMMTHRINTSLTSIFIEGDLKRFFKKIFLKILFIYLERGKGARKKGRETSMCGCLSHAPYWASGPQHRHVPWLGIKPVTF